MKILDNLSETQRLLRNLIRIGTVTDLDLDNGLCRVLTGANTTDWLHWITGSAGNVRSWRAPSIGEQVLILSLGGELDSAVVLTGIFSDDFPAPSASADAVHFTFPDGAVIEYEPATGALTATGIKTATIEAADSVSVTTKVVLVNASEKITLDTPLVECTQKLKAASFELTGGGSMRGDISHSGGSFTSNGVVAHTHQHGGIERGGSQSDGPQ
ncbi:phage baseplate assembly protein V [Erwiniaceae bacterium BAC15a-03b]|uniref:Phage baseplate assembly protein V n=1 Tax=Winslowiella arboricola TaxID=2978220 RepID=A0A9J6PRE6_9GAMM|nr:phage baseplate assembly protein V [Winslowiella arboricola]MCU5775856.1 phage baseplate assembly protein V [Winslowiella arboricola]MCU5779294.1 phage baseplate assembly protein V [Winslowiella arboricola]